MTKHSKINKLFKSGKGTYMNKSKQILMYVEFANYVKAIDNELHDDCWEQVYHSRIGDEK